MNIEHAPEVNDIYLFIYYGNTKTANGVRHRKEISLPVCISDQNSGIPHDQFASSFDKIPN